MPPVTMYGMRVSGHTARTRSYFIKAGIPFCERAPSTRHYLTNVVPWAGGKSTMPTVEFPDGRVIRDSAAIVEHFEEQTGHTFSPATPEQRFFSRLVSVPWRLRLGDLSSRTSWSRPQAAVANACQWHQCFVLDRAYESTRC